MGLKRIAPPDAISMYEFLVLNHSSMSAFSWFCFAPMPQPLYFLSLYISALNQQSKDEDSCSEKSP